MSQLVPINRGDLQEVRLRPAPTWSRALTWGIIGTASFGFIFALVTRIDEVVPAQGQLEPVSSLKPIKAVQAAVVDEIFVKEGQLVKPGQPLIRFDTDKSVAQASTLQMQQGLEQQRFGEQVRTSAARRQAQAAKRDSLLAKRNSDVLTLRNEQEILARYEPLARQGALPELQYLQQRNRIQQIQSEIAQAEAEIRQTEAEISEVDANLLKERKESEQQQVSLARQGVEARETLQTEVLKAPVAGRVFNLIPTSPRYAVSPGEELLKIVPDGSLQAKVYVTSKDVSFVKPGKRAEVRLDSYPFTEYGSIIGKVKRIGTEALPATEQNPQPRFPVIVTLETQSLYRNGRAYPLKSGETVTTNIILRDKRVITLLTDVIDRALDALRPIKSPTGDR